MFKVIATDVVISKGFDNAPALRYSEKGDSVRFRIGKKVYDTKAENKTRWVNYAAKAFGEVCERIQKMQLKEGYYVHIIGKLDEDTWEDKTTGEEKRQIVIIIDEIEYSFNSTKFKENKDAANVAVPPIENNATPSEKSSNFMGFEPFGGETCF